MDMADASWYFASYYLGNAKVHPLDNEILNVKTIFEIMQQRTFSCAKEPIQQIFPQA